MPEANNYPVAKKLILAGEIKTLSQLLEVLYRPLSVQPKSKLMEARSFERFPSSQLRKDLA
jgi:hypothetical protein